MSKVLKKGKILLATLGAIAAGFFVALAITLSLEVFFPAKVAFSSDLSSGRSFSRPVIEPQIARNELLNEAGDCRIKGSLTPAGKIYHLPGCFFYPEMAIDESLGEKWFCSEKEAQEAGWRKATSCP